MKKRSILLLLSALLLGGCMNTSKKRTTEETKQILLDYMSNKYNEEFEITDIGIPAPLGKDIVASMISKKDKLKNEISVYWKFKETGEEFSDDYADLLYKFQANDAMDEVVAANFSDFHYATYSEISSVGIDKYTNIPLAQLMKKTGMSFYTCILLDEAVIGQESAIKERIMQMYEDVKKQSTENIQFAVTIYVCKKAIVEENKLLFANYKQKYTLTANEKEFTFRDFNDDYTKKIIKEYLFSTYSLELGIREL